MAVHKREDKDKVKIKIRIRIKIKISCKWGGYAEEGGGPLPRGCSKKASPSYILPHAGLRYHHIYCHTVVCNTRAMTAIKYRGDQGSRLNDSIRVSIS